MFKSRQQAGEALAKKLQTFKNKKALILAIPRGGVVVGASLAKNLSLPLDVLITRKIGALGNPELAIGAVGPDKVRVVNWTLVSRLGLSNDFLSQATEKEAEEVEKRQAKFGQKKLEVSGKTVILVDDGIATGATTEAAILWLKAKKTGKIILAVPVAPPEVVKKFQVLVDKLVVLETPRFFGAVGQFYQEFPQVSDEEVKKLLKEK